jgi:hypothetical protein
VAQQQHQQQQRQQHHSPVHQPLPQHQHMQQQQPAPAPKGPGEPQRAGPDAQTPRAGSAAGTASGWPPALRDYVSRAFDDVDTGDETLKARVQAKMRAVIQEAVQSGKVWQIDWTSEKSPLEHLLHEELANVEAAKREEAAALASAAGRAETPSSLGAGRNKRRWDDDGDSVAVSVASSAPGDWADDDVQRRAKYQQSLPVSAWQRDRPHQQHQHQQHGRFRIARGRREDGPACVDSSVGGDSYGASSLGLDELEARNRRAARFADDPVSAQASSASRFDPYAAGEQERIIKAVLHRASAQGEEVDLSRFTVRGTSTALEKKYLRLTGVPDPSTVRPEPVLQHALVMILDRWSRSKQNTRGRDGGGKAEEGEAANVSYLWVCEQLKAVRQDLTVQHIHNQFAADVYEAHARIALSERDLGEFNQCQTRLQALFADHGVGSDESKEEFAAYNVLYLLYAQLKYAQPGTDLASAVQNLPPRVRASRGVRWALAVRGAIEREDYRAVLLRLWGAAPAQGRLVLDLLVGHVRHAALRSVCLTVRPAVSVHWLRREVLGLLDDQGWARMLAEYPGLAFSEDGATLDCKASLPAVTGAYQWPAVDGDSVQHAGVGA